VKTGLGAAQANIITLVSNAVNIFHSPPGFERLSPPKRSGRAILCIVGPGNIVIGSGLPLQITGAVVSCTPNLNERLVRIEKTIRASFIIVTSDKKFAVWAVWL
jgi:hypothetical protein